MDDEKAARAAEWCEFFDPGSFGAALRDMREKQKRGSSGVPEDWHPHQLRDKPADPDPERDAEIAKHSAVAIIDAIVQHGGATERTPVD